MLNSSGDKTEGTYRSGEGDGDSRACMNGPGAELRLGRGERERQSECKDNRWDEGKK